MGYVTRKGWVRERVHIELCPPYAMSYKRWEYPSEILMNLNEWTSLTDN